MDKWLQLGIAALASLILLVGLILILELNHWEPRSQLWFGLGLTILYVVLTGGFFVLFSRAFSED